MRLRQGLSLRELARRAGLSKDGLLRLERGDSISYEALTAVCTVLSTHITLLARPESAEDELVVLTASENQVWISHSVPNEQ